jgi:hypothetical protein
MFQNFSIAAVAMMLTALAANGAAIDLQPIPDAFTRLGHSCGGIKQQILGEGFDANGNVTGYVFAVTRCNGSGRGAHVTTYSTWVAVTWNRSGVVIDEVTSVPSPDPSIAGAYHSGGLVGGANYPSCNNSTPYDNAFTCVSVPVRDSTGLYSVQTSLAVINQAGCSASNTSYCTYRAALTTP